MLCWLGVCVVWVGVWLEYLSKEKKKKNVKCVIVSRNYKHDRNSWIFYVNFGVEVDVILNDSDHHTWNRYMYNLKLCGQVDPLCWSLHNICHIVLELSFFSFTSIIHPDICAFDSLKLHDFTFELTCLFLCSPQYWFYYRL